MDTTVLLMIFFGVGIMIALALSLIAIVLHNVNDKHPQWPTR